MQHVYCDVFEVNKSDAIDGARYSAAFIELPGRIKGFAVAKTLKDVATEFKRFLEDHIPNVKDRRAFEQRLTKVKPDGEKGAFGKEFATCYKTNKF